MSCLSVILNLHSKKVDKGVIRVTQGDSTEDVLRPISIPNTDVLGHTILFVMRRFLPEFYFQYYALQMICIFIWLQEDKSITSGYNKTAMFKCLPSTHPLRADLRPSFPESTSQ